MNQEHPQKISYVSVVVSLMVGNVTSEKNEKTFNINGNVKTIKK